MAWSETTTIAQRHDKTWDVFPSKITPAKRNWDQVDEFSALNRLLRMAGNRFAFSTIRLSISELNPNLKQNPPLKFSFRLRQREQSATMASLPKNGR